MAARITALNWDDYKNRNTIESTGAKGADKALESEEDRFYASFDINRASRDQEDYPGNEPRGPLQERISMVALVQSNPLKPPHVTSRMDDTTAAKSAYQHYQGILESGGPAALKLVRDLASEGNKAIQKAREMGNGEAFAVVASHTGVAHVVGTLMGVALEMYPASREDAVKRMENFKTNKKENVGQTIARAAKEGLGSREGFQKLPTDVSKVNIKRLLNALEGMAKPKDIERLHPETVAQLLHPSHLVKDTNDESPTFGRVVGLTESMKQRIAEPHHETIIEQANNPAARNASMRLPASAILRPNVLEAREKDNGQHGVTINIKTLASSTAFFSDASGSEAAMAAIRKAGPNDEIVIGSMKQKLEAAAKGTTARVSKVDRDDKRRAFFLERQSFSRDAAKYIVAGEQMIEHVDKVSMHLGAEPNMVNLWLLGFAAKEGKIGEVTQNGQTLSLHKAQALGLSVHRDNGQMMRGVMAKGLDIEASDVSAAVGLSLLRDEQEGRMSPRDIRAVQASGMNLMNVISIASDKSRAHSLMEEHGVSMQGIRLLGNEQAVANAGRNLPYVMSEISGKGLHLVGPEGFPDRLRNNPDAPVFAIISGDPEAFAQAKGLVGVIGEPLRSDEAAQAAAIAPHMAALARSGAPRAWIDGQTPFPMEPKRGDVVFVAGGLGVFNRDEDERLQDARDLSGATTVSFMVPSTVAYISGKGKAKGEEKRMPNTPNATMNNRTGAIFGMTVDRLLVSNGRDMGAHSAVAPAITEQLKAGRKIAVIAPKGEGIEASPITAALAHGIGRKALVSAGFGASVVESMAMAAVEGGPVAMRMNNTNPEKAAKALADLAKGMPQAPIEDVVARKVATKQETL